MADIFISYIHEETGVAIAVQRLLREHLKGSDVFMSADQWQIYAGEVWLDRIRTELTSARAVVLLMSPLSVGTLSRYQLKFAGRFPPESLCDLLLGDDRSIKSSDELRH